MNKKPVIALTMGDAAGIGPEIILKTCLDTRVAGRHLLVVEDLAVLEKVRQVLGYSDIILHGVGAVAECRWEPAVLNVWDMRLLRTEDFQPGIVSRAVGDAAFRYVTESI